MKNSYSDIIELYIKRIQKNLNDNLEMTYIIGSSATEDETWESQQYLFYMDNFKLVFY